MEVSYSPTIEEFRVVLGIVDRAYPGGPDAPAPVWQNFLLRSLGWLIGTVPIWICVGLIVLISVSDLQIRMWLFLFHDCAADYIPLAAFESEERMNEFGKFAAAKITEHSGKAA